MQFDAEVKWDVSSSDGVADAVPEGWKPVAEVADVPSDLLKQWSSRILETATKAASEGKTLAYDSPTSPGILHWISRFKRFYPSQFSQPGAIHHAYINDSTEPKSLITLVPVFDPTEEAATLIVSFLGISPDESTIVESAYDLITSQAQRYGCAQVEVWEVPETIVQAWQERSGGKVKVVKRKEHLGAMVWYGEEPVDEVQAIGGE
jgi:hypothetical protein